jgi:hypothetical protein
LSFTNETSKAAGASDSFVGFFIAIMALLPFAAALMRARHYRYAVAN